jgi:hypothetical protein
MQNGPGDSVERKAESGIEENGEWKMGNGEFGRSFALT